MPRISKALGVLGLIDHVHLSSVSYYEELMTLNLNTHKQNDWISLGTTQMQNFKRPKYHDPAKIHVQQEPTTKVSLTTLTAHPSPT